MACLQRPNDNRLSAKGKKLLGGGPVETQTPAARQYDSIGAFHKVRASSWPEDNSFFLKILCYDADYFISVFNVFNIQIANKIRGALIAYPDRFYLVRIHDGFYYFKIALPQLDGGHDQDDARLHHDVGDFRKPTDVFKILIFENGASFDVGVDSIEDIANTEEICDLAVIEEIFFQGPRDGLLTRILFAGDEDQRRFLIVSIGPLFGGDSACFPFVVAEIHVISDPGLAVVVIL